jgi:hypothetical protein
MATFTKRAGNKVQVKVRRKGYEPQSRTFPSLTQAKQWARLVESEMDRGIFLSTSAAESTTIAEALARYGSEVAPSKKSFGLYPINGGWHSLNPVNHTVPPTMG